MASLNKVMLIGNLGKDPEVRYTKSQTPFARFSLATTEEFTSQGERQKKTMWHNLVVWGKQAEIAGRYLRKGKQIFVEGKIEYREYDDQNGQRKYITDIRVDRFVMLGSAGGGGGQGGYDQGGYDQGMGSGGSGGYGGGQGKQGGQGGNQGGGRGQSDAAPMTYGNQGGGNFNDMPQSDSFNDDDIPF